MKRLSSLEILTLIEFDFDNDNYQYHSKIYNDPRQFDTDVAESDVFKTSIILPGSFSKNINLKFMKIYISHFKAQFFTFAI